MKTWRTWMHGFGGDPGQTARAMKDAGFDVVVAGGEPVIAAVNAAGMDSWICGGGFGLGKHTDDSHKALGINGEPQIWFGSGSPNHPELREQSLESYRGMAQTEGIKGILVDGCRYASPASGLEAFFTCFADHSRHKAEGLGFDFERMKRDVAGLREALLGVPSAPPDARGAAGMETTTGVVEWLTMHPGVADWLAFRRITTTAHFRALSEIIHAANLKMGVYIFTPAFASLVGQSYVDLREFVDVFAPMIYRNYPDSPGPACINWELTQIPEDLGLEGTPLEATALSVSLAWAGLSEIVPDRTIKEVRRALPPEAVGQQTLMAREQIGPEGELAPIIYIDDPEIARTKDLVRNNGADGVNFFVYKDNWAEMVAPAMPR